MNRSVNKTRHHGSPRCGVSATPRCASSVASRNAAVARRRIAASPAGTRKRGFTLIEIVVAFSILALGLGLALQIAAGAMRNARQAAQRTEAALHAQSLLDTVGVGERLEEGESSGEFDDDYRWSLSVTPFEVETDAASPLEPAQAQVALYRLELIVNWGPREAEREASFVTLRALTPDPNG